MQILKNIIQQLQQQANSAIAEFRQLRGNISIQITLNPLTRNAVDIIFDILNSPQFQQERKKFSNNGSLDVIVDSFGGDGDAAYHIAKLIHTNFTGTINYIIPRFAKSATTLLVCGGNKIIMGETSELGPLDPQILQEDGNYISAKAVQATLELIEKHLNQNGESGLKLATILASRINPLVLGQYQSTLEIAQQYQKELLLLRMFSSKDKVEEIVKRFATGYTHHSRVIDCREAKEIFEDNLIVMPSTNKQWQLIWKFYEINRNITDLLGLMKIVDKVNDN